LESNHASKSHATGKRGNRLPELILFAIALAVLNFPLLKGGVADSMVFLPDSVKSGEWWRVVTHPFAHVSWYHLLLDGGAFLLLYDGLEETGRGRRLMYVVGCGGGSLGLSLLTSEVIQSRGLCGLSGIAHGLMAVSALEWFTSPNADRRSRMIGLASLPIVAGKSLVEMLQGHVFFEFLHFGLMGVPVPACHAGGVLAGILMFPIRVLAARNAAASNTGSET
jgi:rhomboid family GlyGly-CTERM serine protease